MEELGYFNLDDQPVVRVKAARVTAAGLLLLLLAAAVLIPVGLIGTQVLRNPPPSEYVWRITVLTIAVLAVALYFAVTGIGLLRRRRWARPLTVAPMAHWLAFGIVIFMTMAVDAYRQFFYFSSFNPSLGPLFWNWLVPIGMTTFLAVLYPLSILVLVGPERVGKTLSNIDLRPRWTDSWTLARVTLAFHFLVMAVLLTFFSTDFFDEGWYRQSPYYPVVIVCCAAFEAVSLFLTARGRKAALWSASLTSLVLFVIVAIEARKTFRSDSYWSRETVVLFMGYFAWLIARQWLILSQWKADWLGQTVQIPSLTANTQ